MSYLTLGYATRRLPLGYATRRLPLGKMTHRQLAMGDDGEDDFDFASAAEESSTFSAAPVTNQDLSAPDIPDETFNFAPTTGPATPGSLYDISTITGSAGTSDDLNQLILSGQIAPPAGSNLTASQVAQIANAGGSAADIGAVIAGQTTVSNLLPQLANATALAAKSTSSILTSSMTGKAPTPTTVPIGYAYNAAGQLVPITASPGTVTSALSSVESWFMGETMIAGIPNGVIALLGLAAVSLAGAKVARR